MTSNAKYCGFCGKIFAGNLVNECRLCGQPATKDAPQELMFLTARGAAKHYDKLKPGMGGWYLDNKHDINKELVPGRDRHQLVDRPSKSLMRNRAEQASREQRARPKRDPRLPPLRSESTPTPPQAAPSRESPVGRIPLKTWQDAELFAEQWMQQNGYPDAHRTPPGADGGVDVVSRDAVCQVKHHAKAVQLSEIQRLAGIASHEGKQAIFFSLNGYTAKAKAWGQQAGVICKTYRARS